MKNVRTKPAPPVKKGAVTSKPQRRKFWPWVLAAAVAVIVVFEIYAPALHGPFLLDDTYLPFTLPGYVHAPLRSWIGAIRPVLMFSFWLNFKTSGTDPFSYHLVNLFLHLLNGALVFLIVRRVLSWTGIESRRNNILSAFAAGLFLLHPLQTESVAYVASRSETLSVFFIYAAFAVFVYRRPAAISWRFAIPALVLFGIAALTKEHAVALIGVFLLTDYFWNPAWSFQGAKRNWRLYAPIAIIGLAGLAFVLKVLSTARTAGFGFKDFTWYQYFFTECRAFWGYLLLFVAPFDQNIDHTFPISKSLLDHGAVFALIGLLAVIAAGWIWRRRFPLASYGLLVFLILLAPTSSFIPIADPFVERRLYLPFIGLLFIVLEVARRARARTHALIASLGALLLIEGMLSYQRNLLYASPIAIWRDSVSKSPNKVRPRYQLARAYYDAGQCSDAAATFEEASKLAKPTDDLLIDWALVYHDCTNEPEKALAKLREAAAISNTAHAHAEMGMIYGGEGKYAQSFDELATAEKLDPRFIWTYIYRASDYASQKKWAEAAREYERALAIDAYNETARNELAQVRAQMPQGR